MSGKLPPPGVQRNNPFDLMYTPRITWIGQVVPQPAGERLCSFDTAIHGLRAGMIDARSKVFHDGLNTIRLFEAKFAPSNENNTAAYVSFMCGKLGLGPDEPLNTLLSTPSGCIEWAKACNEEEVGAGWYTDEQYAAAASMVFGYTEN